MPNHFNYHSHQKHLEYPREPRAWREPKRCVSENEGILSFDGDLKTKPK